MKASICYHNISFSSSSFPSHKTKAKPYQYLRFRPSEKPNHRLHGLTVGCDKLESGLVTELRRELEAELKPEGEDWMMELGKLREGCKERRGVLEMFECLEREAIMGEDEGREPTDYNRRAQIFDKSSRVFQAFKERNKPGVVEMLECLEREAIMGEDEGREPTDYNRRAQIFDRSSRVFQALKERNKPSHQS